MCKQQQLVDRLQLDYDPIDPDQCLNIIENTNDQAFDCVKHLWQNEQPSAAREQIKHFRRLFACPDWLFSQGRQSIVYWARYDQKVKERISEVAGDTWRQWLDKI